VQANKKQQGVEEILKKPLKESYNILLKDQKLRYMDMKAVGVHIHNLMKNDFESGSPPSKKKLLRLAQEIADLNNSLPVEPTYAIFQRVDKKRVDMMKFLVIGVEGTPYAHGAFEFDFFFPNHYPQGPPKVQLKTTGGGKMWFNPNMYACGKVCLSILGTHPVNSEAERWNPKISTALQVLLSV